MNFFIDIWISVLIINISHPQYSEKYSSVMCYFISCCQRSKVVATGPRQQSVHGPIPIGPRQLSSCTQGLHFQAAVVRQLQPKKSCASTAGFQWNCSCSSCKLSLQRQLELQLEMQFQAVGETLKQLELQLEMQQLQLKQLELQSAPAALSS